ncbi:MAG: UDP-N-acetylmuramate--L-alanine ligase [Candidatus Doudnabacteria bacterium]|nr:UDP-N-acetylmuramate--L-alanine ligase [Candidatus Doudnabacteria bacterium]
MEITDYKKIYFVGIGGIGVSALARMFQAQGLEISGSDMRDSATVQELKKLGVQVFIGHDLANLSGKPDLVIYSEDISPDSAGFIELQEADKLGITKMTYAQALGKLMDTKFGIGVTGTNGKSTTTALLGLILEQAGLDPSVIVGSKLSPKNESDKFKANARLGAGNIFVAEADEYHRHMLEAHPKMIVITNIAEDHLDYYKDLEDIRSAFEEYVHGLPKDGIIIYNADDHNAVEVGRTALCHKFTFGIDHYADLQAINLKAEAGRQTLDLHLNDELIGRVELRVPGKFNVSNALGATLAALKLGVSFDVIKTALENFAGIWRRFEVVGMLEGKPVISDYAHHPAGVAGTIQAAKEFYPGKKILVVFQPHHRNRTKALFGQFVESLIDADYVILPEIFDVAGREHGEEISSKDLVAELTKQKEGAEFTPDLDSAAELIKNKIKDFDAVLCMGAGDIDLMARKLVHDS